MFKFLTTNLLAYVHQFYAKFTQHAFFLVDNLIINKSLSTLHNKKLQTMFCMFIPITAGSCTRVKAKLQFPVAQAQIKTIQLYSWHNSVFG